MNNDAKSPMDASLDVSSKITSSIYREFWLEDLEYDGWYLGEVPNPNAKWHVIKYKTLEGK